MTQLKNGDLVIVSLRKHLFNRKNNVYVEKPPMVTDGVFLHYANRGKNGVVRIVTVEGPKERSFALACIKLRDSANG